MSNSSNNVFVKEYGSTRATFISASPIPSTNDGGERKKPDSNEKTYTDFAKSKKRFIQRALANFEDEKELTFCTLTFHPNITDRTYTDRRLNIWFKQLKREVKNYFGDKVAVNKDEKSPKYFKYVYAVETQKRGAIHYHILMNLHFTGTSIKPLEIWVKQNNEHWNSVLTDAEKQHLDAEFKGVSKAVVKANDITEVKSKTEFTPELMEIMEQSEFNSQNYGVVLYLSKYFSKVEKGGVRTKEMVKNQRIFGFSQTCVEKPKEKKFIWDLKWAKELVKNIPDNYREYNPTTKITQTKQTVINALNDYILAMNSFKQFNEQNPIIQQKQSPLFITKVKFKNDMLEKWMDFLKTTVLEYNYYTGLVHLCVKDEETGKIITDFDGEPLKIYTGITTQENIKMSTENMKEMNKQREVLKNKQTD